MRLTATICLALTILLAGCSASQPAQAKRTSVVKYDLDHPAFTAVDISPKAATESYAMKISGTDFWVARTYAQPGQTPVIDWGVVSVDGQVKKPFAAIPGLGAPGTMDGPVSWLPIGDTLLIIQNRLDEQRLRLTAIVKQVFPEPQKILVTDTDGRLGPFLFASEGKVYAASSDGKSILELDKDLRLLSTLELNAFSLATGDIGGNQLVVGNSPFDLVSRDFFWDRAGVTKRSFEGLRNWRSVGHSPDGTIWFAGLDGQSHLKVSAYDREGKLLAEKVIGPHFIRDNSGIAMIPAKDRLTIAAIGDHQGQPKLILYTLRGNK